jgi:hypothetical protein
MRGVYMSLGALALSVVGAWDYPNCVSCAAHGPTETKADFPGLGTRQLLQRNDR